VPRRLRGGGAPGKHTRALSLHNLLMNYPLSNRPHCIFFTTAKQSFSIYPCMVALFLFTGCLRDRHEVVEVPVPAMAGPACGEMIRAHLMALNSARAKDPNSLLIIEVETDYAARKVIVTFHPLNTARMNVIHRIAELGFDAGDIPGNPARREALPENCR